MIAELFLIALLPSLPLLTPLWSSLLGSTTPYTLFVAGCLTSQLLGYFLGVLPYLALDYFRSLPKIQHHPTPANLRRALANIFLTLFTTMAPLIIFGGRYLHLVGISATPPLPSPTTLLTHLAFFLVVEDFLNYWLHRLLHTPLLYKHVHALHHEFTAPFALMAAYAHPAEVVILSIPTFAGPALVAPHMFTVLVWQLLRNYEAIDIHSGYAEIFSFKSLFPSYAGAEHHDYHHYMHSGNFASVFVWCDKLYGTDLGYRTFQAKKTRKVA